ncbi:MAG: peroxiredoxin [Planctomycetes bacterium]|nr:peroxiredoxin [Planctomycetota bacterium]NOG54294.1 peroxiredoxin [Planctomycetota bacterium]
MSVNEHQVEPDLDFLDIPTGDEQARVTQPAPDFTGTAVVNGDFKQISLSDYQGKNVILFFWPLDFTFVCPTEIVAFDTAVPEFEKRNTVVIGVSTDSHFTHLAWQNTTRDAGGIGKIRYPMVADLTHEISWKYGVLLEEQGIALRGLFLIDANGVLRHMVINDLPLGRSVDEAIRMVDALQHFEEHGEVCPANWKPGSDTIKPGVSESKEYFEKWGSEKG